ncbi:MAG: hypothetical protein LUC96_14700 [Alistipes sp.]|uniref:GxGYxYP domain-containing protein n=1 Tax=Alistipes sp. TaxID=1872444 RepID=UPI0025BE19DD|nr:GxGYxYP domain-containing protein [Alistipes sp.]MCD8276201.1 hypothetical protein [Alistipes sp.]
MKKTTLISILAVLLTLSLPCGASAQSGGPVNNDLDGFSRDWHPGLSVKPAKYWNCTNVLNNPERNSLENSSPDNGLRHHLLTQSVAGLVHRAVQNKKSRVAVWMGSDREHNGYIVSHNALHDMGIEPAGTISALELATGTFGEIDGIDVDVKHLFDGYVLTDLANNPESNIVASVASHVYNAIIVDVRDKAIFDKAGYRMLYDATEKTTRDAWREFRDKCDNRALVLMPVNTGELREFAIANNLFVINLNHFYNDRTRGDNFDLFEEVLAWLKPNSPVYGWDQGIDENKIADCISRWGNHSLPYDWGYNTTMTSVVYPERQQYPGCRNIDPNAIDYDLDKKFVSFYLTDGDNVQWMMGGFDSLWYRHPMSAQMKMTYGIALANTTMIGPSQMANIFSLQPQEVSLFERSSYFFLDTYATKKERIPALKQLAAAQAEHMRMHDNRILGMVTLEDAGTPAAMEGYKILIEANDELDGIIAIQYSPYADGTGRVFWFTNKRGEQIPVVCTKYSVWNTGGMNHDYEGSPAFVARKLKSDPSETEKYSLVCVHAWSKFLDCGTTDDELAENIPDYERVSWERPDIVHSAGAAELCARRLGDDYRVINAQELIWRMRMDHDPANTKKALKRFAKRMRASAR